MDDKVLDEMLNSLIAEAGPKAIENLTKDDLENIEKHSFEFSPEHEEKMKEIFAHAGEEENVITPVTQEKKTVSSKKNTFSKILLVAAIVVLLSGLAIGSVGAWRESFISLFLNQKEKYSDVNEDLLSQEYVVENIFFGYVPTGFELKDKKIFLTEKLIRFEKENSYFFVDIKNSELGGTKINTENGIIEELMINDKDMVYTEREDMKILSWYEKSSLYTVITNTSKGILIRFVEKMKLL